jgi:hypothetical protein
MRMVFLSGQDKGRSQAKSKQKTGIPLQFHALRSYAATVGTELSKKAAMSLIEDQVPRSMSDNACYQLAAIVREMHVFAVSKLLSGMEWEI